MITFFRQNHPTLAKQCCRRSNVSLLNKIAQPLNWSGVCLCVFERWRDYISYMVSRGVLTPLFYEDPLYCVLPHFQTLSNYLSIYIYTFTLPAMCSQQLSLLFWMNNSQIFKFTFHNYFQKFKKNFQIYYLVKSYLLIRCYETRFFLWNTNTLILIEVV